MTKPVTKQVTKAVTKSVIELNLILQNYQKTDNVWFRYRLRSVSVEIIGQLEFWFRYRTETKIVVSVVH